MVNTATFDFIFETPDEVNRLQLRQGDLLHRTAALASVIGQAHAYYAEAGDYSHFLVLTQSCDLVRRKGACKSRYITLCAVRPLSLAVDREFQRYTTPLDGFPIPVGDRKNHVLARQFLERILNNTVDGHFFIPSGAVETVDDHLCAFLPLSIALRADHYETCLSAKVGQVKEIFSAKIGSLASNLYSRIATPDIHEQNDAKVVKDYTSNFFEQLGYNSVVWLSRFEREMLEAKISEVLRDTGRKDISAGEAREFLQKLPSQADAIADHVVEVLTKRGLLADEPEVRKKARNHLLNDAQYKRLVKQ